VIILRDSNVQLGKVEAYSSIGGKHMLHEETNENREIMFDIAITNNLVVMSTQFQHKQIHKGAWTMTEYDRTERL
jgi:hypothetical protein